MHVTAAQMWNLAISLPLMIGDTVPPTDDKWECFLLLLDILQFCTTRVATSAHAGILEALIFDHHHLFSRCYTEASIIPKMHYMVHFPQQITRFAAYIQLCNPFVCYCFNAVAFTHNCILMYRTGPLINTCCMRMEAKNSYFKQIARSSNFKNVPYTVASRHQRLLCAHLQSDTFFDSSLQCGPGKPCFPHACMCSHHV